MSAKITYEELRRTIWMQRQYLIESFINDGKTSIPYRFSNFEKDMNMSELVVDPSTQKRKWKALVDRGFISKVRFGDTVTDGIDVSVFKDLMNTTVRKQYVALLHTVTPSLERDREIERDTHTIARGSACVNMEEVQ